MGTAPKRYTSELGELRAMIEEDAPHAHPEKQLLGDDIVPCLLEHVRHGRQEPLT